MPDSFELRHAHRQMVWAIGLAVAVCGVLTTHPSAQEGRAEPGVRLNGIIERAERGQLIFEGESFRMLPDQEHDLFGLLKLGSALADLRPEGSAHPTLAPVVRIGMEAGEQEKQLVKQYLDAGLMGLILPQVKTPDEVLEFVRSMRYPPQGSYFSDGPEGVRGFSPGRGAALWGATTADYMRKADLWPLDPAGELLAIVLLETKEGVENIDAILEVPGLGAVLVGLGDLSLSFGVGTPAPNQTHPKVQAAIKRVSEACAAHHKRGGKVICGRYQTPEGLEAAIDLGFTMFTSERGTYRGDR